MFKKSECPSASSTGGKMFKSKVILITGSSGGIGAGAAVKFASEEPKAIVLHGRREDALAKVKEHIECAGHGKVKVHTVIGDITNQDVRKRLIDSTIELFGQLDVLINNAGIGLASPVETASMDEFDKVLDINLKSVVALTQLAIPHLIKSKGNIVNISSGLAIKPTPFAPLYGCTKAAVDHLTKCLALELGPKGVRVNSINPGFIPETDFASRLQTVPDEVMKQHLEHAKNTYPLRRAGTVDETTDAILFIASDKAKFVTGVVFPVEGGFTIS